MPKSDKQEIQNIAVILFQFEYKEIPFTLLNQLEEVGLINIYTVLNNKEYQEANQKQFQIFDGTSPKTILEIYQSHSTKNQLQFQIIDSGNTTTEEEKLLYYLDNVKENYLLNLFLCTQQLPGVTPALRSTLLPWKQHLTEYHFFGYPFLQKKLWNEELFSLQSRSSPKTIEFLNNNNNPSYCHQIGKADILNHQWLFNIFVELTLLKISQDRPIAENKLISEAKGKIKKLIQSYYQNITDLETAEDSFNESHRKKYYYLEGIEFLTDRRHKKNIFEKDSFEENFPKIITEIIELYQDIAQQPNQSFANKINDYLI